MPPAWYAVCGYCGDRAEVTGRAREDGSDREGVQGVWSDSVREQDGDAVLVCTPEGSLEPV